MSIPKYDEMYRAFLNCLADGHPHDLKEIKSAVANQFRLSPAERGGASCKRKADCF